MIKSLFMVLTGLLLSINTFAQAPVNFKDCEYEMFFVNASSKPAWQSFEGSISDYFNNLSSDKDFMKGVNGKVVIGIIIYESGKTCCHSFMNLTQANLDAEFFKKAVNEMPDWKPAREQDKEVVFLNNLLLTIKDGKFQEANK